MNQSFLYDISDRRFLPILGYIEPVMVILHEQELTWAGRVSWKHHTCMISALSISTTLKQHPLIWSANVSIKLVQSYQELKKLHQLKLYRYCIFLSNNLLHWNLLIHWHICWNYTWFYWVFSDFQGEVWYR